MNAEISKRAISIRVNSILTRHEVAKPESLIQELDAVFSSVWNSGYDAGMRDATFESFGLPTDPDAASYPRPNPFTLPISAQTPEKESN